MMAALVMTAMAGCTASTQTKVEDLEFDIVSSDDIPEALLRIIDEKKENPFKLTYANGGLLYVVVGYGAQDTGGYSIQVPECYRTEDSIVVDTELIGPSADEAATQTYPYIVIVLTDISLPVTFE